MLRNSSKFPVNFSMVAGATMLTGALLFFPMQTVLLGLSVVILSIYVFLLMARRLSYILMIWFLAVPFFAQNQENVRTALDLGAGNMTLDRLVFLFLIILFFAQAAVQQSRLLTPGYMEMLMLGFCSIVLISLEMHGNFERTYIGVMATRYVFPMLTYFLAKNLFATERDIKILLWGLFALGMYLAITAVFELFVTSLVFPRYIAYEGIESHAGRARGPFLQSATNGTVLGIILLISLYLYAESTSWSKRLLILMSAGLMIGGVLFSLTRGAWLGTGVGVILLSIFQRSIRRVVVPVMFIAAVSLPLILVGTSQVERLIGERSADTGTVDYRYNTWETGISMFLDRPLFGVGFRRYTDLHYFYQRAEGFLKGSELNYEEERPTAHNTYIEIAAELGVIGLVPFCIILLFLLTISAKVYRILPPGEAAAKNFIIMYWGMSAVFHISSSFYTQNSMFLTSLLFTFGGIIARWSVLLTMTRHVSVQPVGSISPTATAT